MSPPDTTHGTTGVRSNREAEEGVASRKVALDVLARIQDDGAFANIALPAILERSSLDQRDRAMVTDLVYGTVRMQRACEFLVGRFLSDTPAPGGYRALLLGAYQLVFREDIPSYAAVSATVGAAPKRYRGLVNAVLRRVASTPVEFPDKATELSYPDWIVELLSNDHGQATALDALASMNEPPHTYRRSDGYVQDLASQMVADHLADLVLSDQTTDEGERTVVDLCAAPGGKTTALAARDGIWVAAGDQRQSRVGLLRSNIERLNYRDAVVIAADALMPPIRAGAAHAVLLDAPCSGLGVLRRRADARWRVDEPAPTRLARLQSRLVDAAIALLRPGGLLVYSVCTLTAVESLGIDEHIRDERPDLVALPPPLTPWEPWGRGAILMPHAAATDGMALFVYRLDA